MKNKWSTDSSDIQIKGLLDRYMRFGVRVENLTTHTIHPDDDSLAAFIEGRLTESEAEPMVNHLVECSFCRHITAELITLDLAFAEEEIHFAAKETQPSRMSEVLNNLLSRIFGTGDSAVFAHQEKEADQKKTKEQEDPEK